ncbi:hypothetical protein ABIF91_008675 [Bradyrhizobium sp. USDA 241]
MRTQEAADQDRQHQHAAVHHRHHEGGPAPLQALAPLDPELARGQRRIDRDDTCAEKHPQHGRGGIEQRRSSDPGERTKHETRPVRLAAVEDARRIPHHAAGDETDGVQRKVNMGTQPVARRGPQRDRGGTEQIGGAPPFQRGAVLLLAEKHHHGAEQCGNHGGDQIERDAIERHHVGPL